MDGPRMGVINLRYALIEIACKHAFQNSAVLEDTLNVKNVVSNYLISAAVFLP